MRESYETTAGTGQPLQAVEARLRVATKGLESMAYGGFCADCGREHRLALTPEAEFAAGSLLAELVADSRAVGDARQSEDRPKDGASEASTVVYRRGLAAAFRPGGGRMLGVALCRTPVGERRVLRAFSGLWDGWSQLPGWAPPLAFAAGDPEWKLAGEAQLAELSARLQALEEERAAALRVLRERIAESDANRDSESRALAVRHAEARVRRRLRRADLRGMAEMDQGVRARRLAELDEESRGDKRELREMKLRWRAYRNDLEDQIAALQARVQALTDNRRSISRGLMRRIHRQTLVRSYAQPAASIDRVFQADEAPPSGAGDCCAPKLIQAAIQQGWAVESLAEIWFGAAPPSGRREHGSFHGACAEKCQPLLGFMLCGLPAAMKGDEPNSSTASVTASSVQKRMAISKAQDPKLRAEAPEPATGQPLPQRFSPPDMRAVELPILYQDSHFVLVDKPSGLLSVPGRGPDAADSVIARIRTRFPEAEGPLMVHRLDMDCSGLMLVALRRDSQRALSMIFEARKVVKHYVALLEGRLEEAEGEIELAFRLDPRDRPRQVYDPVLGKPGISRWRWIGHEAGPAGRTRSRVHFEPITGRTHQLRLHASHPAGLGLPIVGDRLYGNAAADRVPEKEGSAVEASRVVGPASRSIERLMLHACHLAFHHPSSGEMMRFDAPAPF